MAIKKISGKLLVLLGLILIFLTACLANEKVEQITEVCFQNNCFDVELAVTAQEQARGLMYRDSLDKDSGMLFIYPEEKQRSFWMKNTLIPLDIIWIDKDYKVVYINKNAQPCGEGDCPSINPEVTAKYVLELNAGTAEQIGLAVGSQLQFK